MKILVFGSKGFIAGKMLETWADAVGTDARIDDKEAVLKALDEHKPDAVVNAAGKTGKPNVDWCETHQAETFRGNTIGALVLAEACQERGIYMLHLATGCIFYGPSPDPRGWTEDDHANPSAVYTRSKYAADLALTTYPNVAIARLRMPIDDVPSPRNLIDKLVKYKQIIDVANSATVISDLVDACYKIIQKRGTGVFHTVNPGIMRHRDLLNLYRELVDPTHTTEWIREEDLVAKGLATKKRSNNIMQSDRLKALGIEMRPIDVALRDTMMKYAAAKRASERPVVPSFLANPQQNAERVSAPSTGKRMKGVILAGGKGTRLAPLTNITNKHLLPIGDKQMVLYPLQTLLDAGIREIMIVTGPDHAGHFMNLLGSGYKLGCRLTYRVQDEAGGIPHALALAEDFVGDDHVTVILGDNLFEDNFSAPISTFQSGAMTFYKPVPDAHRFGVVEVDSFGHVLSIEEKPQNPKTNFAQAGLYIYDSGVFDIIRNLRPSGRGELEIVDVNNAYLQKRQLAAKPIRGFWTDAGTFESLQRANEYFSKK
ncbi:sugar nucleotide-binding protein [Candidatus Uhrbacteria bacterium]|nr:sugar nucleotide-binding protein [Candidatus Uhrbacteria bacterium]